MITRIEALNYRCLRYIARDLGSFHVLVGPNASGKTTFLDVIAFLKDIVIDGLEAALTNRTTNPEELLYARQGDHFEMAIEARIPDALRERISKPEMDTARYEVSIGFDDSLKQFEFKGEKFLLKLRNDRGSAPRMLFPMFLDAPETLLTANGRPNTKVVVNKVSGGNDNFYSEIYKEGGKGWTPSFKLGPGRSAMQNLPADEAVLPIATWFRDFLSGGVQRFILNSQQIKMPSPPTRIKGFLPDGSNLPWVVERLREDKSRYQDWISHLQTALPDLEDITTITRPEDKHCYLVYKYTGSLQVPSWLVSDGTLRLTALTLPAYLKGFEGIYMIEEPENGIHPKAVSTVYDSLSSIYTGQVILASHSPVILNSAMPKDILCFAKTEDGATDIVSGAEHPLLQKWRGETPMGTLLAAGVLG